MSTPSVSDDSPRIEDAFRDFTNRKVTLIGLGRRTHVALARYLVKRGALVRISERKPADQLALELGLIQGLPIELQLGGHQDADVVDAEIVFVTPDAPRDLPILEVARRNGALITNEIELLFARCRAPIVGITGSAGKTTTTTLVGEMCRADQRKVYVGGNIGVPLIELVDEIPPDATVVLELSSFQLETLQQSPRVGAILNVTPNHLDRHKTFEHYRESKFNLLRHQGSTDIAVLGADDPVASSLAPRCPGQVRFFSLTEHAGYGSFRRDDELVARDEAGDSVFALACELKLPGTHNVLNVLAAAAIARAAGVALAPIRRIATSFKGVEHRLELVRELDDVAYYNDSIATSPERAAAGLRAIPRPVVLIAGGRSKHLPLDDLVAAITANARAVVTFGEMAVEIEEGIRPVVANNGLPVARAGSLAEAVVLARRLARPGDAVLLSPGGTSFDQFRDFEERGQAFKALVLDLATSRAAGA
jgi:UDP-N-acetylmuramoylalanine--D-glutamate ligase